jgi:DNA-directed RNA polymerase subunit K/omega
VPLCLCASVPQINKNMAVQPSIITRDTDKIALKTGNVYESVFIASQRARQIAVKTKEELTQKLSEFASSIDNLEEIFENREQIEISKFYERQPKPTSSALEEFMEDKINYRYKEDEI